jgi:hypothetical protein
MLIKKWASCMYCVLINVINLVGIDIFDKEAEKFIQSGDSWSGKIKIRGAKRILDVILTPDKRKESTAALLYNEHV